MANTKTQKRPPLGEMKLADLTKLKNEVEAAIQKQQSRRKDEARKAAQAAAAKRGFTLQDLLEISGREKRGPKPKKQPSPPKFVNPGNPEETWSGHGRQPAWYKDALAAGTPPETMKINQS